MDGPKYQVALSFAGEQRDYVEEVARHLQSCSIAVFYNGFETVRLWDFKLTHYPLARARRRRRVPGPVAVWES